MQTLDILPDNLPIPSDDGDCLHLIGARLPSTSLKSTDSTNTNLALIKGWLVVYCYPMTGQPNKSLPEGWDEIPGARGCTPQSCNFRDNHQNFTELSTQVYGLSTQSSGHQLEAVNRLHLPYALLSDNQFQMADALKLPTFEVNTMRLIKRVTLIIFDGVIKHYFYPVFPPDKNADEVITWLKQNA